MRRRTLIAGALAASLMLAACGGEAELEDADVDVEDPTEDDGEGSGDDPESEPDAVADAGDEPADTPDPASPAPDPQAVEDPCADHQGREDDAFIELVSPVDGQVVGTEVELVGCSNVFEATVAWNLLDGDGVLLDEGFTTAECGTGCVGAFRETISLEAAAGEPAGYLEVFSPDMADGEGQLALTEVVLTLE